MVELAIQNRTAASKRPSWSSGPMRIGPSPGLIIPNASPPAVPTHAAVAAARAVHGEDVADLHTSWWTASHPRGPDGGQEMLGELLEGHFKYDDKLHFLQCSTFNRQAAEDLHLQRHEERRSYKAEARAQDIKAATRHEKDKQKAQDKKRRQQEEVREGCRALKEEQAATQANAQETCRGTLGQSFKEKDGFAPAPWSPEREAPECVRREQHTEQQHVYHQYLERQVCQRAETQQQLEENDRHHAELLSLPNSATVPLSWGPQEKRPRSGLRERRLAQDIMTVVEGRRLEDAQSRSNERDHHRQWHQVEGRAQLLQNVAKLTRHDQESQELVSAWAEADKERQHREASLQRSLAAVDAQSSGGLPYAAAVAEQPPSSRVRGRCLMGY